MPDPDEVLSGIRTLASADALRVTRHAQQEMVEEAISLADVLPVIANGPILEHYPDHRRGPCCLGSRRAVCRASPRRRLWCARRR